MRIAIDQHISKKIIPRLTSDRFHVVRYASGKEKDSKWVLDAIKQKVIVIVSTDYDIPRIISEQNVRVHWLRMPHNLNANGQYNFIVKMLTAFKKKYKVSELECI